MTWFSELHILIQTLIATLFTYLLTALGALSVVFIKNNNKTFLQFLMGLASGIMIAASFWSLLLPSISLCEELGKIPYLIPSIGFFVGGVFIVLSDIILTKKTKLNNENKSNILLVTSITVHNIPEGMAIGVCFASTILFPNAVTLIAAIMLAIGIGIQNFPEGACVVIPLRKNGMSKAKSLFIGQFSGFVEIVAGVIGCIFTLSIRNALPFILSLSAGSMIAVVCSELIPDAFSDNKKYASLGVILGFIIMMIFDVALG